MSPGTRQIAVAPVGGSAIRLAARRTVSRPVPAQIRAASRPHRLAVDRRLRDQVELPAGRMRPQVGRPHAQVDRLAETKRTMLGDRVGDVHQTRQREREGRARSSAHRQRERQDVQVGRRQPCRPPGSRTPAGRPQASPHRSAGRRACTARRQHVAAVARAPSAARTYSGSRGDSVSATWQRDHVSPQWR